MQNSAVFLALCIQFGKTLFWKDPPQYIQHTERHVAYFWRHAYCSLKKLRIGCDWRAWRSAVWSFASFTLDRAAQPDSTLRWNCRGHLTGRIDSSLRLPIADSGSSAKAVLWLLRFCKKPVEEIIFWHRTGPTMIEGVVETRNVSTDRARRYCRLSLCPHHCSI